jgi:DNA recombination protein RmuC
MNLILIGILSFIVGLIIGLIAWYRAKTNAMHRSSELESTVAELKAENKGSAEKLEWMENAEDKLREAFKSLASDALNANTEMLTGQAKKDISSIVDPLKENLTSLDGHVRELEKSREGAYKSLEQQLKDIKDTHTRLQETTSSLSHALSAPTVRGRWGELQLRRVVELAGMVNHVAFDEQATTDGGRPDMIVHLPNGGVLPVDSKVPLSAYKTAMESDDEEKRARKLSEHAGAMKGRIQELGQKQYWDQFKKTPDFVVMFVPNEACLGAAFDKDPGLLEYAIEKKVLISSPVTLLALLRSVAYGWQQHKVSENALKIVSESKELYKRLKIFLGIFEEVGKSLSKATEKYNKAVGSMQRRLIPQSKKMQELHVSEEELSAPEPIEVTPRLPAAPPAESADE